jgi:choline dehydrogenase-like flavoprotein
LTLAQVFAEFKVPTVSERWVHAQLYAVNNYILERMGISPWVVGRRRRVFAPLYERLLIALVGLHSDHSGAIELNLSPEGRAGFPVLRLRPVPDPRVRTHASKVARHFSKALRPAGVMTLPFGLTLAAPGGGNHFGCTMPMTSRPRTRLEADILGRPAGWQRIHVVDGAVLPSIPATTITLLQMANADRIASAAELS